MALLAQIIKKKPIILSKQTDGKTVAKKINEWESVTQEFNSNPYVHKRETITLKRAWDNLKSFTRRVRERGNLIKTGIGPDALPPPPEHVNLMSMVEEVTPGKNCQVNKPHASDWSIFEVMGKPGNVSVDTDPDILDAEEKNNSKVVPNELEHSDSHLDDTENSTDFDQSEQAYSPERKTPLNDYIRREAVMRLKHFESKMKAEMEILKTQLEVEQIKKKAALLEEQTNITMLEKAKLELEEVKRNILVKHSPIIG